MKSAIQVATLAAVEKIPTNAKHVQAIESITPPNILVFINARQELINRKLRLEKPLALNVLLDVVLAQALLLVNARNAQIRTL